MNEKETKKTVWTFALASFLNDFGSDIIYPIWPLFVTTFLKANMAVLGFIDGLGEALVSISQAVSGYVSDRIGKRKAFIWSGYLCGSVSRIGYALSSTWMHLIPFRILDRAGKMRGAPRDAILADISTQENRGHHFGILRAMDNLGAVVGIIACVFLFPILGYRNLFLLAAIPSIFGSLLIIFFVKERKAGGIRIYKGLSFRDLNRDFKRFLFLSAIFALGSFSYSFLLIYAKEFGFKAAFIPILYLIFSVVASISSIPFGRLSDRIGRKPVLMMSFIFWGLICFLFIVVPKPWAIIFTFILYGLHKGALETVQKALVSELAPVQYRASSLGGFQMVIGLCALPSSFVAGLLWDKISFATPFYLSLGLTIISGFLLLLVSEKSGRQT